MMQYLAENIVKAVGAKIQQTLPTGMSLVVENQDDNKLNANVYTLRIDGPYVQPVASNEYVLSFDLDVLITIQKQRNALKISQLAGHLQALLLDGFNVAPYGCFASSSVEILNYGQADKNAPLLCTSVAGNFSLLYSEN